MNWMGTCREVNHKQGVKNNSGDPKATGIQLKHDYICSKYV